MEASPTRSAIARAALAGGTVVPQRRWDRAVCGVLLLALLLRIAWAATVHSEQVSDARAYHLLARQLAADGTYGFDGTPYAFWPVGYPFFLSLFYRLVGESSWLITAASIVLNTGIVGMTVILARRWLSDNRIALIAGAIMALYPVYVQWVTLTASETLFTVLMLTAMLAWGSGQPARLPRAFATGVCLGLAAYVRPIALGVVVPLAVARWLSGSRLRTVALESSIVLGTVALTVAPWTYRNYRVYGRFVPVSTNGGMCFFFGNNPLAPDKFQAIIKPHGFADDAARDAYCIAEAIKFIRADPAAFVWRSVRKAVRMWERDTIGVVWNETGITKAWGIESVQGLKIVSQAYWMLFILFCAGGMLTIMIRQGWRYLFGNPGVCVTIAFTGVYVITYSQDRYHFPLVPLLAPFGAFAINAVWTKCRLRGTSAAATS